MLFDLCRGGTVGVSRCVALLLAALVLMSGCSSPAARHAAPPPKERPPATLTAEQYQAMMLGPCTKLRDTFGRLFTTKDVTRIGLAFKRFTTLLGNMRKAQHNLRLSQSLRDRLGDYVGALQSVARVTHKALRISNGKTHSSQRSFNKLSRAEVKLQTAAHKAQLYDSCSLGNKADVQDYAFRTEVDLACVTISKATDKQIPDGVATTPAEQVHLDQVQSAGLQRYIAAVRRFTPKLLPPSQIKKFVATLQQIVATFGQLSVAVNALDLGGLDAGVKRLDALDKQASVLANSLGLLDCRSLEG